jgi:hypothetical protein
MMRVFRQFHGEVRRISLSRTWVNRASMAAPRRAWLQTNAVLSCDRHAP